MERQINRLPCGCSPIAARGARPSQVARLDAGIVAAFAAPEVRESMAKQGNQINPGTPEAAEKFFRSELAKYAALVKRARIKVD